VPPFLQLAGWYVSYPFVIMTQCYEWWLWWQSALNDDYHHPVTGFESLEAHDFVLFYRAFLQKRPTILSILLTRSHPTPYEWCHGAVLPKISLRKYLFCLIPLYRVLNPLKAHIRLLRTFQSIFQFLRISEWTRHVSNFGKARLQANVLTFFLFENVAE